MVRNPLVFETQGVQFSEKFVFLLQKFFTKTLLIRPYAYMH